MLKSLRCSARFARAKSKSAVNLNGHLKKRPKQDDQEAGSQQEQRSQKGQTEERRRLRQSLSEDQPIYANLDEVLPTKLELEAAAEDALMGNAQVSPPQHPSICVRIRTCSRLLICVSVVCPSHPPTKLNRIRITWFVDPVSSARPMGAPLLN